jgi:hypothetical protein
MLIASHGLLSAERRQTPEACARVVRIIVHVSGWGRNRHWRNWWWQRRWWKRGVRNVKILWEEYLLLLLRAIAAAAAAQLTPGAHIVRGNHALRALRPRTVVVDVVGDVTVPGVMLDVILR